MGLLGGEQAGSPQLPPGGPVAFWLPLPRAPWTPACWGGRVWVENTEGVERMGTPRPSSGNTSTSAWGRRPRSLPLLLAAGTGALGGLLLTRAEVLGRLPHPAWTLSQACAGSGGRGSARVPSAAATADGQVGRWGRLWAWTASTGRVPMGHGASPGDAGDPGDPAGPRGTCSGGSHTPPRRWTHRRTARPPF